MKLWIVGKAFNCDKCSAEGHTRCWEFQGAFDNEALAVDARLEYNYFVGPAKLNRALPAEVSEWPGAYYPLSIPA